MITGGTGSVGMVLARALLKRRTKQVRLLSNDENGLFEAKQMIGGSGKVSFMLGDVRDSRSLERAMKSCDVVIHAAALKHVTFCEDNPYEAISTNVVGTQNVIDTALAQEVKRFIYISTDKAVNPSSTMGATKLLGEKLTIEANGRASNTVLVCVRFGNIFGSRGSVIRVFERNVAHGGPVIVTNPEMTRFLMLSDEAQDLVLQAGAEGESGDIFVLKMKAVRIGDLAEVSREYFSKKYGLDTAKIGTRIVGLTPGEKMHEELLTNLEYSRAKESDRFFIVRHGNGSDANGRGAKAAGGPGYSSNNAPLLSRREIHSLLERLSSDPIEDRVGS